VLAFALVPGAELDGRSGFRPLRGEARLLGFVGQIDPPARRRRPPWRAAAKQASAPSW